MTTVRAHGVGVRTSPGWDARINRRPPTEPEETTHSVTHIGNFPLPRDRGDFGTGAVERMGRDDVLVVLVEFDAEVLNRSGLQLLGDALLHVARGLPDFEETLVRLVTN